MPNLSPEVSCNSKTFNNELSLHNKFSQSKEYSFSLPGPLGKATLIFLKIIIFLIFPFCVSSQSVTSFTLINADTEQEIGTLIDGQVLNLSTLPTNNLNVIANTDQVKV